MSLLPIHYFTAANLRETQPRTVVLSVLLEASVPLTHKEVYKKIVQKKVSINLTTVYRILQKFADSGLIHTHVYSGGVVLCEHPRTKGHHVLLCCKQCGVTKECLDSSLCKQESVIANKFGFSSIEHKSELVGLCSLCS
jgi:Fur family transcriptional regulator, ferric uptake regulator